jgi:hypothetical protein
MSELIDRYVEAATRSVPQASRDDIASELRVSIADQLDDRLAGGEPDEAAERAVLTELGDPEILAAKYSDRPLHLIGPRYFADWKRLLILLLWIVVPFAALGGGLSGAFADGATGDLGDRIGGIIGGAVGLALSVAVHVAFWVTLVFAILERDASIRPQRAKGIGAWSPDLLPLTAQRRESLGDVVASFVWLALATGFVFWDRAFGVVFGPITAGRRIPLLHDDLWPWWIAVGLALTAASALIGLLGYVRRRWTRGLAIGSAVVTAVGTILAMILFVQGRLIHPAFIETVLPIPATALQVLSVLLGVVIVGIGVWSVWDAFRRLRVSAR